jgi:hypothetical protein
LFSLNNTISKKAIAVAMAAGIALMILKMYLNPAVQIYPAKEKKIPPPVSLSTSPVFDIV